MSKLTLLTATAVALILLPGLAFTGTADAQRRHDDNGSLRSGASESEDRGRALRRGIRSSRADNQGGPQHATPPPQRRDSSHSSSDTPRPNRISPRGDRGQGRGAERGNQAIPAIDHGPRTRPGRPGAQPRTVSGYNDRPPRTRPGRPDTHPGTVGGSNPRGPRTRPGRPDTHPGTAGGYNPRGPRTGHGRPDSHPGTVGGYNPRGPRTSPGRHTSHPGTVGGYNPRGPRVNPGRHTSRPGTVGGYNPRGHRPGNYRNDHRRREFAQRRRAFYHSDHRNSIRWVHHMNVGWNRPYYGHYGPSTRWRYNSRYYDYGYNNRQFAYYDQACRYDRNGNGTAVGAVLGAIIGGAAANGDNVGTGILLGAGFGALLGSAVSQLDDCDKVQYQYAMNYAFENGQAYYWGNPYSGVRGSITIRETYSYANTECRWGDAEIYMPDGTYNYDRVRMCRDAYGDWEVARQQ